MKIFMRLIGLCLLLALGLGAWLLYEARHFLDNAPEAEGREIHFDVLPGEPLGRIAQNLREKGLITDARKFAILTRLKKQEGKIQAGRFALSTNMLPEALLDSLVNGKPMLSRLTIPEGLNWWQTARLIEEKGFARAEDFAQVIVDPEFLRHYGIPFESAEGFLMPDTYLLKKPEYPTPEPGKPLEHEQATFWKGQARAVAGRLVDNFWRKAEPLWPDGKRPGRENLRRWVTLASIVEKETGLASERARVAGVYQNRLDRGMFLQADPTVIYGLGAHFEGRLKRVHLEDPANAYNTYQHPGLPPGPIASFGMAALAGSIAPEKHDYIYFVSKPDSSGHNFSRSLSEHNRAVQEYRRGR